MTEILLKQLVKERLEKVIGKELSWDQFHLITEAFAPYLDVCTLCKLDGHCRIQVQAEEFSKFSYFGNKGEVQGLMSMGVKTCLLTILSCQKFDLNIPDIISTPGGVLQNV